MRMQRPFPGGLLIAVEGIDGAGKTSVATLLAQWCGERGIGCVISKEPTGLKWGEELRRSAKEGRLTLERELELFLLDRKDHVGRSIGPALEEGNIVILDRYFWSTAAYQGARGADVSEILEANRAFAPEPDLFLFLDVEVDAGLDRIGKRGDTQNLFETKEALTRARAIFEQLVEDHGNGIRIATDAPLKSVFAESLTAFKAAARAKLPESPGRSLFEDSSS